MVFIGGPRQVGKNTLSLSFLGKHPPIKASCKYALILTDKSKQVRPVELV